MGISILSYRGQASLAVIADARLVPDPEAITEQFNREFARMRRAASAARARTRTPAAHGAGARKAVGRKPAAPRKAAPRQTVARPRSA